VVPRFPFEKKRVAAGATVQSRTNTYTVCKGSEGYRLGGWIVKPPVALLSLVTGAALALGCANPSAIEQDDVRTDIAIGTSEPSIFAGVRDDDPSSIPGVVALKVGVGGTYELCSGALIAPNVVLTARHCVANSVTTSVSCDENGRSTNGAHVAGNQAPTNVHVFVGAAPKFSQAADATGKAIVAPDTDHLCDTDIALIVLDKEIADVEPVPVRLRVSGAGVVPKEKIRSVGYGQNDKKLPIGTRLRKPGVEVLAMGRGVSESRTALGVHEFEVGRSICQGDSGGPAISEDTGAVIGVVSRGGDCTDDYGHIYTTTTGWSDLFTNAFKIAGGAPIVESGDPVGPETGAKPTARPIQSPLIGQKQTQSSCAASPGKSSAGLSGVSGIALLGVALLVLRARRKNAST
jgi:MYXO-CTERM domain-containing protein